MYTKYLVNNSKKNKSWLENQIGEVRVEGARGPGGQGARGFIVLFTGRMAPPTVLESWSRI